MSITELVIFVTSYSQALGELASEVGFLDLVGYLLLVGWIWERWGLVDAEFPTTGSWTVRKRQSPTYNHFFLWNPLWS